MCAGISQRHLSPADVDSAATSLGISGAQLDQLKQCTKPGAGQSSSATLARPEGVSSGIGNHSDQITPRAPVPETSIEASFRRLANPDNQTPPPSPARPEQFGYSLFLRQNLDLRARRQHTRQRRPLLGPGISSTS
jgi:hypothetical protein